MLDATRECITIVIQPSQDRFLFFGTVKTAMTPQEELLQQRKENAKLQIEILGLRSSIRRDTGFILLVLFVLSGATVFSLIKFDEISNRFADVAQYAHETLEYETKIIQGYEAIMDDYERFVAAHNELARQVAVQESLLQQARREASRYGIHIFPEEPNADPYEAPELPEFPAEEDDAEEDG